MMPASKSLRILLVALVFLGIFTVSAFIPYGMKLAEQPDPARLEGAPRSGKWPGVRAAHLKAHPTCEVCGAKGDHATPLQVHHVSPFHIHPELELDENNLITLCQQHHLLFGHLDSWKSWNKNVREDAKVWREKLTSRP